MIKDDGYKVNGEIQPGASFYLKKDLFEKIKHNGLDPHNNMMDCTSKGKENRPALFVMRDKQDPEIMWMIPGTTRVSGKKDIIEKRIDWARKDGIEINKTHLHTIKVPDPPYDMNWNKQTNKYEAVPTALLLQNMFPITKEYIASLHVDKNTGEPIKPPGSFFDETKKAAQIVIDMAMAKSEMLPQDVTFEGESMRLTYREKLFTNVKGIKKMLMEECMAKNLLAEYKEITDKNPNKSVLVEKEGFTYALGETAKLLAEAHGIKPRTMPIGTGLNDKMEIVRIGKGENNIKYNAGMLLKCGKEVACKRISGEVTNFASVQKQYVQPQRQNHLAKDTIQTRQAPAQGKANRGIQPRDKPKRHDHSR